MSELPSPPVPADADLRHFRLFPLDCVRFWESETLALCSGDELRAAIMLWTKSWHQVPAGSLPADERLLCGLAGLGRDLTGFSAVRGVAMRGWYLCDDGRLYHDVIAEAVNHNWKLTSTAVKQAARMRQAKAEKAKARRHGEVDMPITDENVTLPGPSYQEPLPRALPSAAASSIANAFTSALTTHLTKPIEQDVDQTLVQPLGNRKVGNKDSIDSETSVSESRETKPKSVLPPIVETHFQAFYLAYPRHTGPDAARRAYGKAVKRGAPFAAILEGAKRYADECKRTGKASQYIKHPATWLNAGCWADEDFDEAPKTAATNGYFEAERIAREREDDDGQGTYDEPDAEFVELAGPVEREASGDFDPPVEMRF